MAICVARDAGTFESGDGACGHYILHGRIDAHVQHRYNGHANNQRTRDAALRVADLSAHHVEVFQPS